MAVKKNRKKQASIGCLFWIAFILLIFVLFFMNKQNIASVVEKTGLMERFSGRTAVEIADPALTGTTPVPRTDPPPAAEQTQGTQTQPVQPPPVQQTEPASQPARTTPAQTTPAQQSPATQPAQSQPAPAQPAATPAVQQPVQTRKATLFFVSIDADGRVLRREITRDVPATASPLTETLQALLAGPVREESSKGLRSLIAPGTRLLSVSVKDGVASINLSEEFQFNQYGIEGYLAQLAQVVFTATAFPTVNSVQFLIEGQRREYLGAEGVWIGTPLTRDKF